MAGEYPRSCGRCLRCPPPFRGCYGLLHYRSPVDKLLASFKFQANFAAGIALSRLLAQRFLQHYERGSPPELLIPVPLHPRRLRQRGFNQALLIAREIARVSGVRCATQLVVRKRDTAAQSEQKSVRARRRNITGAFAIGAGEFPETVRSAAIIDDVVTTTATVTALSNTLRTAGIEELDVWCIARASRQSP